MRQYRFFSRRFCKSYLIEWGGGRGRGFIVASGTDYFRVFEICKLVVRRQIVAVRLLRIGRVERADSRPVLRLPGRFIAAVVNMVGRPG